MFSLPSFRISLPSFSLPTIDLPTLDLPRIDLPFIDLNNFTGDLFSGFDDFVKDGTNFINTLQSDIIQEIKLPSFISAGLTTLTELPTLILEPIVTPVTEMVIAPIVEVATSIVDEASSAVDTATQHIQTLTEEIANLPDAGLEAIETTLAFGLQFIGSIPGLDFINQLGEMAGLYPNAADMEDFVDDLGASSAKLESEVSTFEMVGDMATSIGVQANMEYVAGKRSVAESSIAAIPYSPANAPDEAHKGRKDLVIAWSGWLEALKGVYTNFDPALQTALRTESLISQMEALTVIADRFKLAMELLASDYTAAKTEAVFIVAELENFPSIIIGEDWPSEQVDVANELNGLKDMLLENSRFLADAPDPSFALVPDPVYDIGEVEDHFLATERLVAEIPGPLHTAVVAQDAAFVEIQEQTDSLLVVNQEEQDDSWNIPIIGKIAAGVVVATVAVFGIRKLGD
jgi:hypothetical protein